MQDFINSNGGLMATVGLTVLCLNIFLTAVKTVLDKVKDKTESKADNKLFDLVTKLLVVLSVIVDWTSANREHKDDPAPK